MIRSCANCGAEFEAKRSTAKYCSGNCRALASQGRKRAPKPAALNRRRGISMAEATRRELAKAGRLTSSAGVAALELARRVDAGGEPLAAVATAVREHAAAMERALRKPGQADPVEGIRRRFDEVGAARERRSAAH